MVVLLYPNHLRSRRGLPLSPITSPNSHTKKGSLLFAKPYSRAVLYWPLSNPPSKAARLNRLLVLQHPSLSISLSLPRFCYPCPGPALLWLCPSTSLLSKRSKESFSTNNKFSGTQHSHLCRLNSTMRKCLVLLFASSLDHPFT